MLLVFIFLTKLILTNSVKVLIRLKYYQEFFSLYYDIVELKNKVL